MVYQFLKAVVQLLTRLFYKSVHVTGIENVPKKAPLLIAMNHPGGFMEPILLASIFPRPLYFLVRGDMFKKAWLKPLLDSTNQLPIYRFKDGFSNLKKNQSILNAVNQKIHEGNPVLIYVEGSTEPVMQLRPLQKGMARMAFDALNSKEDLDLKVLPVGINFTYPTQPYSEVMLNIGEPFDVANFKSSYDEHPNKGYTALTQATKERLKELVLHVDDLQEYPFYEDVLNLYRSTLPFKYLPRKGNTKDRYLAEKSIVDQLNRHTVEDKTKLTNTVRELKDKVTRQNLTWSDFQASNLSVVDLLLLIVGFPICLIGLLVNIPFLFLGKYIADSKVKKGGFYASVMGSVMTIGMIFYYFLLVLIGFIFFSIASLLIPIIGITLGCFAHYYFFLINKWKQAKRHKALNKEYLAQRDQLLHKLLNY